MATATVDAAKILAGPGILYWAPLDTADPDSTVAGGTFDDTAWPSGWVALGSTAEGHQFSDAITTEDMTVAETMYAVRVITTGREASWTVALSEVNLSNLQAAMNGPTPTTSGSGDTSLAELSPADVGGEVRARIGWQSEDDTVRLLAEQVLQIGGFDLQFRKGAQQATISCQWRFEKPSTDAPYKVLLAGETRTGIEAV